MYSIIGWRTPLSLQDIKKNLSLGLTIRIASISFAASKLVNLLACLLIPLLIRGLCINSGLVSVIDRDKWGYGTFTPLEVRVRFGLGGLGDEPKIEFGKSLHNGHPTLVKTGQIV